LHQERVAKALYVGNKRIDRLGEFDDFARPDFHAVQERIAIITPQLDGVSYSPKDWARLVAALASGRQLRDLVAVRAASHLCLLILAFLAVDCVGPRPASPPISMGVPAENSGFHLPPFDWPPARKASFELGDDVVPTSYELDIDLPSSGSTYTGTVRISVDVTNPVSTVWLHAEKFESIRARVFQGETVQMAALTFRPAVEQMGLQLSFSLKKGPAVLELEFEGSPSNIGIFKRGTAYFTQFEPTYARTAFPCFDEPRFKTPWTLHLTVDEGMAAFGNAPVTNVEQVGDRTRYSFAETRPISSYLVAFVAGPLRSLAVDDPTSKMRVISHNGSSRNRGEIASRLAPGVLSAVEVYLDLKLPYPKQDLVVVPDFMVGGMENPGLITLGERFLTHGDGAESALKGLLAHEFAHLWFGDSVTMRWWDDVWLNESLAKFIAEKIAPSSWSRAERELLMQLDALPGADAVYQLSETTSSVRDLWFGRSGAIEVPRWWRARSWAKGAAMLAMIEGLVGEEALRRGLTLYLKRHADGVVTAQDFARALSEGARYDLRAILKSFVTQTGVPMITATLECSKEANVLTLSQKPYRLLGEVSEDKLWHVPVCTSSVQGKQCFVLREQTTSFELPSCPKRLHLDSEARGLYRYRMPERLALDVAKNFTNHSSEELVSLAYSLTAALRSGDVSVAHALEVFGHLAKSESTAVVRASLHGFQLVADLLPASTNAGFVSLVAETWGPVAMRLQPIGHRLDDIQLAQDVVRFAGIEGGYGPLLEQATAIDGSRWRAASRTSQALRAIQVLQKGLVSSVPITPETLSLLLRMRRTRARAFRWFVENYESLNGTSGLLVPRDALRFLDFVRDAGGVNLGYGSGLCSEEEASMLETFASPHVLNVEAAKRPEAAEAVSLNVANIRRCARLAAHHQVELRALSLRD